MDRDPKKRLGSKGYDEIKNHPFFKSIDWKLAEKRGLKPPVRDFSGDDDDSDDEIAIFTNQKVLYIATSAFRGRGLRLKLPDETQQTEPFQFCQDVRRVLIHIFLLLLISTFFNDKYFIYISSSSSSYNWAFPCSAFPDWVFPFQLFRSFLRVFYLGPSS